jgi:hypothetical protein
VIAAIHHVVTNLDLTHVLDDELAVFDVVVLDQDVLPGPDKVVNPFSWSRGILAASEAESEDHSGDTNQSAHRRSITDSRERSK